MTDLDRDIDAWLAGELEGARADAFRERLRHDRTAQRRLLLASAFETDLVREIGARGERRRHGFASTRLHVRRRRAEVARSERPRIAMAVAALLLVGVGLGLARLHLAPPPQPGVAHLADAGGMVELRRGTELIRPQRGTLLLPDDRLVLDGGATADIRFADGTSIALGSGTTVVLLAEDPGKRLILSGGHVIADVAKQVDAPFEIATPHSRLTVLGTRFTVEVDNERTALAVSEGRVAMDDLRSGERQLVSAGRTHSVGPAVTPRAVVVKAAQRDPRIGIEVPAVGETSVEQPFNDVFRSAGPWHAGGAGGALALDDRGWVTRLESGQTAETAVCRDLGGRYPAGRYVCTWTGQGRLDLGGDATVVSSRPGRIEVEVDPGDNGIQIVLRETDPADPIRDIHLWMPGTEGLPASQPFHAAYLDRWRGAAVLHAGGWAERRDGDAPYTAAERLRPGHGPLAKDRGRPVEDLVDLGRALKADIWLRLPHQCSDDYVDAVATAVLERLAPGQLVYVELGRDLWDGAWEPGQYALAQGKAQALGGSYPGVRWYTQRSREVWARWRAIAGDDPRLVRVLSLNHNAYLIRDALEWQDARDDVDVLAVNNGLGGVVSFENHPDELFALDAASACDRLRAGLGRAEPTVNELRALVGERIRVIGVRCGASLAVHPKGDPPPNWRHFVHVAQFANEPEIRTILAEYLTTWQRASGDLVVVSLPMDRLRDVPGPEGKPVDAMGLATYQAIEPRLRMQQP